MPEKQTLERARRAKREGKSTSTQAGEFVREEIHHIREGKHGARSAKQAIAIGLSKARRAGVKLKPPKKGTSSARVRHRAQSGVRAGQRGSKANLLPNVPERHWRHCAMRVLKQPRLRRSHARLTGVQIEEALRNGLHQPRRLPKHAPRCVTTDLLYRIKMSGPFASESTTLKSPT